MVKAPISHMVDYNFEKSKIPNKQQYYTDKIIDIKLL